MVVRLTGLVLIVLGVLFWTGNARFLIPLHMLVGIVLVVALWVLAGLGARAGVGAGRVALAVLWGLLTVGLGMTQGALLPGDAHWVVQVLHLLVGLAAMGMAEGLAAQIGRRLTGQAPTQSVAGAGA
jgi:hypothetical protein